MSCDDDFNTNIEIKRGDNTPHYFQLSDENGLIDISGWTNLNMAVNPNRAPIDDTEQLGVMSGSIQLIDGENWIVFTPPGNWPAGSFYYDASCLDADAKDFTFVDGKYLIKQDITKV